MTDRWLEIAVCVDRTAIDDVQRVVSRVAGARIAVEHPGGSVSFGIVRAYLADGPDCQSIRQAIEEALWHLSSTEATSLSSPTVRWVRREDYSNAWRAFYRPLPIGRKFMIVPSWLEPPGENRRVIRLDPGMAFGTGLHPTTQLAVEAVERVICPGARVVDLGTGSGILAIVAALAGAASVVALDTDPDAVRTAKLNVAANDCNAVVAVGHGTLPRPNLAPADVLVANIVADVHLRNLGFYIGAVVPGGALILGGVDVSRDGEVRALAERHGAELLRADQSDNWVCFTFNSCYPPPIVP